MEQINEKLDLILSILNKPKRSNKHLDPNLIIEIKKERNEGKIIKDIALNHGLTVYAVRLALKSNINEDDDSIAEALEDLAED